MMLQDEAEIAAFVDLLKRENVRSYLEIGSKFGGSLRRVADILPPGAKIAAVDLPNGTRAWPESRRSLEALFADLKAKAYDAHLIWGDSTSPDVVEQVHALGPFDAVFIDANHTYGYVEKDWNNYGPLGRLVAFHDIAWRRSSDWKGVRIDVPDFWCNIRGSFPHEEIRLCPTGEDNGIGVVRRC